MICSVLFNAKLLKLRNTQNFISVLWRNLMLFRALRIFYRKVTEDAKYTKFYFFEVAKASTG